MFDVRGADAMVIVQDGVMTANEIETALRRRLGDMRASRGLGCVWDDVLCHLLSPALEAYELERAAGVSACAFPRMLMLV